MKQLTREEFQDQFKVQFIPNEDLLVLMQFEGIHQDTPVFRALNRLVIVKGDGRCYI